VRAALGWALRGSLLGGLALMIFGPLANLALWAVAIQWYFPTRYR
jgi:putative spermidine/putrescine transport system permease protein